MLNSIEKQTVSLVSRENYVALSAIAWKKLKPATTNCIAEQTAPHQYCSFQFHSVSSPRNGLVWLSAEFLRLKSDDIAN